ncbi:helix-turn-helix domain-containing protein [Aeoliella sp.]|uniref:helix-turn-helix domain-containing protein n=1 Tax=Aeoliella sp. TaxID=2795800 RepID=UPI003CCC3B9F
MLKNETNKPSHVSTPDTLWEDLGFSPEEAAVERIKTKLHLELIKTVGKRGLTQKEVGELLGMRQPHVSKLLKGDLTRTSVDRLTKYLHLLGKTVSVSVRTATRMQGSEVA